MAKLHRRFRKKKGKSRPSDSRPAPKRNPPLITEVFEYILPGFAAFAATRFGTRIAMTQVDKRWPQFATHAGAATSVGAFLAAWLLAHKVKFLEKYQAPLMVGSGIAALQSLMQIYLPAVGWCVSDATPELAAAATPPPAVAGGTSSTQMQLPPDLTPVGDDPNDYVYNDSYDAGRYNQRSRAAEPPRPNTSTGPSSRTDEDMLADLDLDQGWQTAGGAS